MSRICTICGKGTLSGHNVSHSNRRTKRVFKANLQKINIIFDGTKTKTYVCTTCIKGGKVQKY